MTARVQLQTQIQTISRLNVGIAIDSVVVLGFALFALAFFIVRVNAGYPLSDLRSDGANIASWAAAWDHPEFFEGDIVLSNLDNFRIYATVHIPLIRLLARVTGDFGWAFVYLLGPHVFLQAFGFYLLGCVLFQNRFWAVLLAVTALMFIPLTLRDYWGLFEDPQPRFTFQALLPFLLAAAIKWRTKPAIWPGLMGGAGLLMYVHPPSAPAWALAIWAGLWAFHPADWSLRRRIGVMFSLGVIFLTIAAPFLSNYLQTFSHGATTNYAQVYQIMADAYHEGYLDISIALREFISIPEVQILLSLSIPATVIILKLRPEKRRILLLVGLWLAGLLTVTLVFPLIDQSIARAREQIPVQFDLIRGIRYLIPMMLLLSIWSLAEIGHQFRDYRGKLSVALIGLLLAGLWVRWHPLDFVAMRHALHCARLGKIVCADPPEGMNVFDAVREFTPPGARIMVEFSDHYQMLGIRYTSLRPLVFHRKDRGILSYSNHEGLLRWNEINTRIKTIEAEQDIHTRIVALLDLARELDAQYFVIQSVRTISPEWLASMNEEVVFMGETFYLVRL